MGPIRNFFKETIKYSARYGSKQTGPSNFKLNKVSLEEFKKLAELAEYQEQMKATKEGVKVISEQNKAK